MAHQHFGSWCLGYLYISPEEMRFQVGGPVQFTTHSFRAPLAQITAREWVVMGQPQNVTEIKYGGSTYHFWLLGNQDLTLVPAVIPQQIALSYTLLLGVIQLARNASAHAQMNAPNINTLNSNAPNATASNAPDRSFQLTLVNPSVPAEKLLADAQAAKDAYHDHYQKTGDLDSLVPSCQPAREKANQAYQQFLARNNYPKAAESLVLVADLDRMLVMANPAEYQVKQGPIKEKYLEALRLADQANDPLTKYKALKGLVRANVNSKNYAAAADENSRAIELAATFGSKDDLFDAYEQRAELEQVRGNLSAASDYSDRALQLKDEIKDQSLLWHAYTARGDIYVSRADQCDFATNYQFCKQVSDAATSDIQKALEIADRLGLAPFKQESQKQLNSRKMLDQKRGEIGSLAADLSKLDTPITKPSQVIISPRFSYGPNPNLVAEAKKIEQQMKGPINSYSPLAPYTRGKLKEWEGDDSAALADYLQAVKFLENDRRKIGDREGGSSFLGGYIDIYYAAALQELDRKQYAPAFDLLERSRARALAEMLASRNLSFRTPELQNMFSQSMALRAKIGDAQNKLFNALGSSSPDQETIKTLQAQVDDLQHQHRDLEAKIRERSPKLATELGDQPPVSLDAVQAAAARGKYDLLYYVCLPQNILVWHISENSVHVVSVYYSRAQLAKRIAALRESISDPHTAFDPRYATELFLVLVNPVLPYIKSSHLVIVPHGDLNQVPFQVLKPADQERFLGESFQISYAPSATILAGLSRYPDFAHGKLLAVADPGITKASSEVNTIAGLYPGRAKVVSETLPSKESLNAWTNGYNLLHLSVHGVFDAGTPLLSYLQLRPAQSDDGRLTAAEMFGLPLPDNSLVVLSACESGRVSTSAGNDVLGMVPALLFSGASTLVLSSWKVDAASTAVWMETFYRQAQTRPPSEAAQRALLAVKKQHEFDHPFYWAPFLITGQ